MKYYDIPPDIREKEKIIGGKFTVGQIVFLIAGFLLALLTMFSLYSLIERPVMAVLIGLCVGAPFVPYGFRTIPEMGDIELFQYRIYQHRYRKSRKDFINVNENYNGAPILSDYEKYSLNTERNIR